MLQDSAVSKLFGDLLTYLLTHSLTHLHGRFVEGPSPLKIGGIKAGKDVSGKNVVNQVVQHYSSYFSQWPWLSTFYKHLSETFSTSQN